MFKRIATAAVVVAAMGLAGAAMTGCSTSRPGVKNYAGGYETSIAASPDKVVEAAKRACEDLKLLNIQGTATALDGQVTAGTAQGDEVDIEVKTAGDNVSTVHIRVGTVGDEGISMTILDKIKKYVD